VLRSKIILLAAQGFRTEEIAERLEVWPTTVSQWQTGLQDEPRPGKPREYDATTEWSGKLVSKALGNVSEHHFWRVLRKHGIDLQRPQLVHQ